MTYTGKARPSRKPKQATLAGHLGVVCGAALVLATDVEYWLLVWGLG